MTPVSEQFLTAIRSSDAEARYAAWSRASEADPEVILELGKLLATGQPGVAKAAGEALKNIVHSVGKEPAGARRAAVVRQLITLTTDVHPTWTRTTALRHLSVIGGDESAPAAARLLANVELQEEAVFCLERIPGAASTAALMTALPKANDAFKPRILAALGHRRADEAAGVCAAAMSSKNLDVAMAGMKALGRIGKKPSGEVKFPAFESLSGWQKAEWSDSYLRFADEQARRGAPGEAIRIYRDFLNRSEEHLQCAAIIGLSKTGAAESAALIFPKLKSANNTVRITARKAWSAMGNDGPPRVG